MLDKYIVPHLKPVLRNVAKRLQRKGVTADQVTIAGFVVGMLAVPAMAFGQAEIAFLCLVLNRLADGLDLSLIHI